jgi:hypothetical protein
MPKTFAIGQILTPAEYKKAADLYRKCAVGSFNRACADEIIKPALARINRVTGQENDPSYLAYAVEYALIQSGFRP